MQFESHSELEMQLDAVDPDAVARWIEDRILSFVNTYIAAHENKYYLKDQMVLDPVTGTEFPKIAAGATLERDGTTYYFISEETRRKFEKRGKPA
jgi:YHS domain-containing protein